LSNRKFIFRVLRSAVIALSLVSATATHANDDLKAELSFGGRQDPGLPMADAIVVHKSTRQMELKRRGQVLRNYKIQLGLRPSGAKEEEGDFRTPEGVYRLARRNPRSDYFLSIEISYPNDTDLARAKRMHVKPGSNIMIHGLPNVPRKTSDYYAHVDWTDGCIAVSNADMVEIWLMTRPDTPIEILP
jgi:murein L,D-transpeptidase YafK